MSTPPEHTPLSPPSTGGYPYQRGEAIKRVSYTHDAMIDAIITNPAISNAALASLFGYTPSWVSLIKSSDAFRARLAARREELVDPAVSASLEERFHAVTTRSLEVLGEKLAVPAASVPDQLALQAAALGARALGLGANAQPVQAIPVNHLDQLADRLIALQAGIRKGVQAHENSQALEGEFREGAGGNPASGRVLPG